VPTASDRAPAVRIERGGGVVWCTLDRPPLNLLDGDVIREIATTFAEFARDPALRLVVLSGTGRVFTAGMDVRVLRDLDVAGARELITSLHGAIELIHRAPVPVIAAINGACLGAGLELALACDLRISVSGARLGLPEVRIGVPSVIHAALLPLLIGPGRAAEMLLTGDAIEARRALEWGLVNDVVPAPGLRAAVDDLAARILACGPGAIRLQKELLIGWRSTDLEGAVRAGIDAFAAAYATGEPCEYASAFLEKRPPRVGAAP
jgi:enoyl-CoA hydratase/carnithine racemase